MEILKIWDEIRQARENAIESADRKLIRDVWKRIGKYKTIPENMPAIYNQKPFLISLFAVIGIIFAVLSTFILLGSFQKTQMTTNEITYIYPVNQTFIATNITYYPKPQNTANCIKVQSKGSTEYVLTCEVVE